MQAQLAQLAQGRGRLGADLVAQSQQGGRSGIRLTEHHHRLALLLQGGNPGQHRRIQGGDPARCQQLPEGAVDATFHPHAVQGAQLLGRGQAEASFAGRHHHGAGQRVMGALLDGRRQCQQLGLRLAIEAHQFGQLRLAQGQGAGLVKGQGIDVGEALQRGAPLMRAPCRVAAASAEVTAAGVEMTGAQGQPISSSASPR